MTPRRPVAYCGRPRRQHDFEGHAEDIVHVLDELEHADDLLRNLSETEDRCRVKTKELRWPRHLGMEHTWFCVQKMWASSC